MSDKKNKGEEYSLRLENDEIELDFDDISVGSFDTNTFSDDSSLASLSSDSEASAITQVPRNRGAEEFNLEPLRLGRTKRSRAVRDNWSG
ncbi:MAG: hypothetical protein PQ612_02820 [Rickettsiales bacterium]|nr:hypothetical protein [Pseudomonadota bacterium]MDA0965953.1 hypothetical protein [Pseudomonadota bacterium]MDG4542575.1 hypothetical protein [Rickettsiales bacterium]MDG4545079.1 hypothetical protein [Rickettsiales bacterium]MDG4547202.1 hypothetical protein [Rickettsiales bacterium]